MLTDSGRPLGHQTVWLMLRVEGIEHLLRRMAAERSTSPKLLLFVADTSELNLAS